MAITSNCPRSLLQILIAAASTAAFIAAANFGFAPNISSKAGIWERWFLCLKMELAEPFRAFAHSLLSAVVLRDTLSSKIYEPPAAEISGGGLQKIREKLKRTVARIGSVAIMLNCPIFIQIPPEIKVELVAAADSENQVRISKPEWMKTARIASDIHDWNALELPPAQPVQPAGTEDHHHVDVDGSADNPPPAQPAQPLFIRLHPTYWSYKEIDERRLLLKLNFVPQYEQLRYLRSRSTFEAVVTTVQSVGYMLSVAQRIVMNAAVSPLEAIMAFFNLLIVLQFILNLYACVHYQRPLLLRLSRAQFQQYFDLHTNSNDSTSSTTASSKVTRALILSSIISVGIYGIIQFAFIHYALKYIHHCILCSLSAFLVCFLALSALILIGLFVIPGFKRFWKKLDLGKKVQYAFRTCTAIISISSPILALVATIIRWEKFKQPSGNLLEWIYNL